MKHLLSRGSDFLCVCVCVYSHSVRFFELADLLYLIHEISAVYVLHDKIQTVLWRGRRRASRERQVTKCTLIKMDERSKERKILWRWKGLL